MVFLYDFNAYFEVCYKKKIEKGRGKMVDTVVKVSNLTKSYGKNKVLSGVNITLERQP